RKSACQHAPAVGHSPSRSWGPWRSTEVVPMHRRGLKWAAAGTVGLMLVVLGVHLAWERHRYRLETPRGAIRIGMTREEVTAVLGPADEVRRGEELFEVWPVWRVDGSDIKAYFDLGGCLWHARCDDATIPRPSLFRVVRSWLTKQKAEPF